MKFFTKQSSKTVAKRFVLLFLTMLAFGFTANAQIPTFNEILERYYNPQNLVVRATAQTPPYGQQFENYTFEEWEVAASKKNWLTGSTTNYYEPTEWNSFKTATGSFAGSAEDQIAESSEKRPGSTGSKSAKVFSKKVMGLVLANGNMTNGRIYAGSIKPEDNGNYNFTNTDDAKFNTQFTSMPDSLTVWVAFKSTSTSNMAKITTTIHGNTALKQLATSGNSPVDKVCATADATFAPTSTSTSTSSVVWKRMSIPFAKGSHNDPRYILATFNTNEAPGGGSDGDELYVDDICLIYKPTLNVGSIAQTEYNITNDLTANIEVPFTLTGSMSVYNLNKAANEVIAQLSDANGSFESPIELGRVTTDVSGTINGVIPAGLLTGKGYRVRVVSTNYPMTSDDNGTNLVINCLSPQVTISKGDVLQKSATIKFTPTEYCAQYYIMAVPASETVDVAYVKAKGEVKTGTFTKTFENLVSRTDYAIYALPVGGEGELGKLTKILVKTQAFAPQINDIEKGLVTAKSITVTFTPTNTDCAEYYFMIAPATETVDAATIKANNEKQKAALTKTFKNLTSNTAYKVYALPVDVDGFNGEIKSVTISTPALVPTVTISEVNVETKSATATFTPNADCVEYYFMIAPATETVDAAKVKAEGERQTTASEKTFENLISNTDYVIYVLSIDVEGNGPLSTTAIKTQAFVPQINDIEKGLVTAKSITVKFTPTNADCAEYYFMIAPATETVDAATIKANNEKQTAAFEKTFEDLTSNTAYTIYVLPVDVDGFNGEIKSVTISTPALVPQTTITTEVLTKSATVTFTPNPDCVEYYFLISTETVDAAYVKENGEAKTAAFEKTFENLTSNTAYTIYVLSIDVEGNGPLSTTAIKTQAFVPQINDIEKGLVTAKSITVKFTPNLDCYEYYFMIAPATETVDAATIKANNEKQTAAFEKTFEDLTSNTAYTIYVLPVDVDGFNGEIKSVTISTPALVPQTTITTEVLTKSATVTFTPNPDCSEYYFMIAESTETVNAEVVKSNGERQTTSFEKTFENLISNTDYVIYVLSIDVEGNGPLSTTAIKTQAFVPQINDIGKGLVTAKSITVTFTPTNTDCAEYYFVIATDEVVDAAYIKENGEKQTAAFEKTFEDLTSNTAYTIYVLPVDIDGFNGEIKSVTISTPALVPQTTITTEVLTKSATVTFTPNSDCVEYYFMIAESTETVNAEVVKSNGEKQTAAFEKTFENLISNTDYVIYVLSIDAEGNGPLSTTAIKTQAFVPQINDIEKGLVTAKSITVTFTPTNADCAEYYFVIAKDEVVDAAYIKENGEKQTATFKKTFENLTSNTAYKIYALPVDVDGFNGEIKSVTITTNALVPQVVITKDSALAYSMTTSFAPNTDCVEYYFMIAKSTETVNAEVVKSNGEKQTAAHTATWESLLPSTNYTIYALPIDEEGKEGNLNTLTVKTRAEAGVSEIDIEIEKLSYTSATITATPNENTVLYHYIVIEKDEADAMGEDALMQRLNENVNYIDSIVDTYSMTVESNVAYYVVAQGKNRDDKWGVVTKEEFTVAGPAAVETTVEKLNETSVKVTATPNENTVSYQYIVIKKEEAEAMDEAALIQKLEAANSQTGVDEWTYTVESNVEYYVIARGKNADGMIGEMTQVEFTVAGPATVAIAVEKLNETTVTVAATPNENAVAYSYIIIAKAEADAMTSEEIAERLNASENKFEAANTKEFTVESNVAYYVVAQGKNRDDKWGVITQVEFTVAGPAAVETTVEKLNETSVKVTATPNKNTVSYQYIVIKKEEAEAMDEAALIQKLEAANSQTGVDEWTYTVESNVEYYVIARGKNADGMIGEMTQVEFTVAGPATVAIAVEKLNETTVTVAATPNENAVEYSYIIIAKAEADAMTSEEIAERLNASENKFAAANTKEFTVESNVAYYVIAQAVNADDMFGVIAKAEFVVAGPASVETTVEKLNETSVKVTATPNGNTVSYQYIVIKKEEAEAMDEAALIQKLEAANSQTGVDEWTYTVESNVEYYVIARGKNADGMIGEMTQVEFTVAGPATVAIAVEKLNETTVTVAATPNENAVEYHYIIIEKAEADTIGEDALMERLNSNEDFLEGITTKEFTVESNVAYYVMAQAVNADDMNGVITQVEFTVAGPAAVETAVEKLNETSVKVTATPNENTVSYQYIVIKKAEADTLSAEALIQKLEAANSQTGVDEWTYTVESNVEYYVIARGKNADGMIGEMTQVEFTVAGPATVAIAVEKLNETTVTVAATPNENAVEYSYIIIAKAEADTMTSEEIAERLNASENKFEAANTKEFTVESNLAYYVMAQAVNADDMNGVITQVEFTVAGPAAVSIVVEEVSKSSVKVTATPNENTVSYQYIVIEKAEADTLSAEALIQKLEAANDLNGVDEWTYTIKSNVEYYVIAQGKNADGMIGEMTQVEFMVEEAGPAIVEIEVKEVSDTLVSITATPNENTVEYHYIIIEKAEADTIGEDALMERLNSNEDFLEGITTKEFTVESNVEYYVIAQAVNADSVFGKVTMVEFLVEGGSSVSELNHIFEVYPNPASEYVRITSNNEIESLIIFSIDGKIVYSEDVNQEETMIDVTSFAKGSYLVKMVTKGEVVVKRIIVK